MVKFEPRTRMVDSYPPSSFHTYVTHPYYGRQDSVPIALFNDHRFAFFFWALWNKEKKLVSPTLITLDWHQDLYAPDTQEELKILDIKNTFELSFFSWARLNPANDDHIKSAMYRNIIGDAIIICKQGMEHNNEDAKFEDMYGNIHIIKKFKTTQDAYTYLQGTNYSDVYFDIDLDYFTIENCSTNSNQETTFVSLDDIEKTVSPDSDFMYWIFQHIKGFTIALEPTFVGGLEKSIDLYNIIEKELFTGSIFRNKTKWKHF